MPKSSYPPFQRISQMRTDLTPSTAMIPWTLPKWRAFLAASWVIVRGPRISGSRTFLTSQSANDTRISLLKLLIFLLIWSSSCPIQTRCSDFGSSIFCWLFTHVCCFAIIWQTIAKNSTTNTTIHPNACFCYVSLYIFILPLDGRFGTW